MSNMPFECVIRALRLNKKLKLPEWKDSYIVLENGEIRQYTGLDSKPYYASSVELLSEKWEIK